MEDRQFTGVDLRRMMEHAGGVRPGILEGRFVVGARHAMKNTYLEVTFRHGKPIAGYYYLPREAGQKPARTRRVEPGLIIDLTTEGQAIGIEITAPSKVSLEALNAVLQELGHPPASAADLAPVLAA